MTGLISRARAGTGWLCTDYPKDAGPMPELTGDEWALAFLHAFMFKNDFIEVVQEAQLKRAAAVILEGHVQWDDDFGPRSLREWMLSWANSDGIKDKVEAMHAYGTSDEAKAEHRALVARRMEELVRTL